MAQQYGTVKCDVITFTSGTTGNETDVSLTVSGLSTIARSGITVTGDIQGNNITATNDLTASGLTTTSGLTVTNAISGNTINTTGNIVTSANVTGDTITSTGALNVSGTALVVSGATIGGSLTVSGTGSTYASGLTVSGTLTAGTVVTTSNVTVTGDLTATGTISGATITGTTGNFTTGNFTTVTTTTANVTSGIFASGTAAAPSISVGTTDNGIYSPGTDQLAISTNGTGRLFINSAGNVGIGTASPAGKLHVSSAGTTRFFIEGNDGRSEIRASNGNLAFYTNEDANASGLNTTVFYRNGTNESMRIDSSGRLLVGTSSARENLVLGLLFSAALQVEGTNHDTSAVSLIRNSNDLGASYLTLSKTRGTTNGSNTIVQNNDGLGNLTFLGADGINLIRAAEILAQVDGTPGVNDMPGRLVFSVTADGSASPSEAMRINNAGELLVGYTSDNGAYKLQVNSQIFATSATIATSDGRYKENVASLDGCVDLVKALRPVSFDWKAQEPVTRVGEDGETVVVREAHNFPDGKQVGFIAQEVEEVLADKPWLGSVIKQNVRPSVTDVDGNELAPEEEFLGIAEGNLVAVLTSALKDAIGRIESLEAKVAALENP